MSLRLILPLIGLLLSLQAVPVSALQVVASVKPLQLLAAALLDSIAEPELLVPADASPHHYALKPSDMRRLAAADLVLWVGPELELFLVKPLSQSQAPVLQLLSGTADAGAEPADRSAAHPADEHQHEHHHEVDAHIWMGPVLMLEAAQRLQQQLAQLAPHQAARLEANFERFATALQVRDQALRQRLAPLSEQGFFVFHDAYGRFVRHYGLNQLGYFTVDPGRQPGARRLSAIRRQLEQQQAVCVFSEPQFRAAVVQAVTEGLGVRHAELDPLARAVAPTADGYLEYLSQLGESFAACLGG